MGDYAQIRAQLESRRDELVQRLELLKKDIRRANNPDFAEQATEREGDEVLDALDEAGRAELDAVTRALAHIESGDYGVCVECDSKIPVKRLEVLPFTELCVACAEKSA